MAWSEFRKTINGVDKKLNEKTGEWETGNWYVIGRDPKTGKRMCKPAGLKSNIKKISIGMDQIEVGVTDRMEKVPIQIAYDEYEVLMKKTRKVGTWSAYSWGLEKLLKFFSKERIVNVGGIKNTDMIKFRASIMPAHSINGMLDILKIAKAFFSYCIECGYIVINPAKGITRGIAEVEVGVALTDAQARHILSCINDPEIMEVRKNHAESKNEFADIIKTVLLTGMREGEIAALKVEFIRDGKIYLRRKGKGAGKLCMIPINSKLAQILEKYKKPGRVFVFEGWNTRRIKSRWNRLFKRARKADPTIPARVRFHDLRHTFASNYLRSGGTLADLKLILGHSNIKTTARYAHFQDSDLAEKMEKLKSDFLDALPPEFRGPDTDPEAA